MTSQTKSILIGLAVVLTAVGALLLTTSQSDSDTPASTDDVVFSGNPTTTGEINQGSVTEELAAAQDEIIVEFLPRGGIGAACTEDIGVQVAQGFSAEITINGTRMAPEELNVILNPDGTISSEITATRSKGQFSFPPEDDCPNGKLVRPTDNVLSVCVYSTSDITKKCVLNETYEFDAI